jgi:hypothetical protein
VKLLEPVWLQEVAPQLVAQELIFSLLLVLVSYAVILKELRNKTHELE